MSSRNPDHKDMSLWGVDPKFLREHSKKGLKKMVANKTKALRDRAEAIRAPESPKIPKGTNCTLEQLSFITHPTLGKHIPSYMARGHR
jgi:hypothetical protein